MCKVQDCSRVIYSLAMCNMHYQRFKKYGNSLGGTKNHAPPEERFWRFVEKFDGCWKWSGKKNNGYGTFSKGSKKDGYFLAHRFSWELHNKRSIPDGMFVMHKCDNPDCCNPEHLIIGTPKENTQDMIAKGRRRLVAPLGAENGKSVLNEEKVKFIRSSDFSHTKLAKLLEVSPNCVRGIRIGRTWAHIK